MSDDRTAYSSYPAEVGTTLEPIQAGVSLRDPTTWRVSRVWQYWLMAMLTLLICSFLFGADEVGGFIGKVWSRVPIGVVSVPPA